VRSAGAFGQRRRLARLLAAQPLAHAVARTAKHSCRILDTVLAGVRHELLVQPMPIRFHPIQFEVAGVHEPDVVHGPPARFSPQAGGRARPNDNDRSRPRSSRNLRTLTTVNFTTGGSRCTHRFPESRNFRLDQSRAWGENTGRSAGACVVHKRPRVAWE